MVVLVDLWHWLGFRLVIVVTIQAKCSGDIVVSRGRAMLIDLAMFASLILVLLSFGLHAVGEMADRAVQVKRRPKPITAGEE